MPKINVYLPDALADRVRDARLPVSRICQIALTQALESISDTGGVPAGAVVPDSGVVPDGAVVPDGVAGGGARGSAPEPIGLTPPPNHHVGQTLRQAYEAARSRGAAEVDTADILQALLDEGESLALNAIELLGFPRSAIRSALKQAVGSHRVTGAPALSATDSPAPSTEGGPTPSTEGGPTPSTEGGPAPSTEGGLSPSLSSGARTALAVGAAQAAEHGSDLTTASHLLLGLIQDPGPAGEAMRLSGVADTVTPAVLSALYYGVSFGRIRLERDTEETWLRTTLAQLSDRLGRIERRLDS